MKILFLGDIVGRPGRKVVLKVLPDVLKKHQPDVVIANTENLAGGKGITRKTLNELKKIKIDVFTGGNHTFSLKDDLDCLEDDDFNIVRPANLPPGTSGHGWIIVQTEKGERLLIINLLGRVFMPQMVDCPMRTLDRILSVVDPEEYDAVFVDFHAEATGEKQALRWDFDGLITALIGTHTHVPTADSDISHSGTAFQADAGMNGSLDSSLGVKSSVIIESLRTQIPAPHELEKKGRMQFNAVLVSTKKDGSARSIQHIQHIL